LFALKDRLIQLKSENGKLKPQMSNLKAGFDNLMQKVGEMVKRKKAAKPAAK
jgi:hypothetical protein